MLIKGTTSPRNPKRHILNPFFSAPLKGSFVVDLTVVVDVLVVDVFVCVKQGSVDILSTFTSSICAPPLLLCE